MQCQMLLKVGDSAGILNWTTTPRLTDHRFTHPGTHHHRPAIDANELGTCHLLSRLISHRIGPHTEKVVSTRGQYGKQDSFAIDISVCRDIYCRF